MGPAEGDLTLEDHILSSSEVSDAQESRSARVKEHAHALHTA